MELQTNSDAKTGSKKEILAGRSSDEKLTSNSKVSRIPALDFTKGALVLIMVLYHWINYFYGPNDNRYLRFLTPSFIFITGFLISHVYFSKYGIAAPRLPIRLIERGLKIIGIFALLNVARSLLMTDGLQEPAALYGLTIRKMIDVYLIGSGVGGGQTKTVAFFILVPIGYLLILSALLLVISRYFKYTFHAAFFIFLLCIFISDLQGLSSPNLELLAIGLLGVLTGYLPIERVNTLAGHHYFLAAAYLVYLGAITIWNVSYPLQIIGVCLSLLILYLLGKQSRETGRVTRCVILLGKYSLVGYIAQIGILQLLRMGMRHIESEITVLVLSLFLAFALTIISVEILDRARAQSGVVDKLYKAVFA